MIEKIEKEIEAVENVIRLLKNCLAITIKRGNLKDSYRIILKDLQLCKNELKRLNEAKNVVLNSLEDVQKEQVERCDDSTK